MLDIEFIEFPRYPKRAKWTFQHLTMTQRAKMSQKYTGDHECIFFWGWGGVKQQEAAKKHLEAGGKVFGIDIGYFRRSKHYKESSVRLMINEPHPQNYLHLAPKTPERWLANKTKLENLYDPDGHILICGVGRKTRNFYNQQHLQWEAETLERLREIYPEKKIIYRPKPSCPSERLTGTIHGGNGPITDWLRGCALCVCYHSNVSTDCVVYGVPSVCVDGAGAAFWPNSLEKIPDVPSEKKRLEYLHRLSYFNYMPHESRPMLNFIESIYESI